MLEGLERLNFLDRKIKLYRVFRDFLIAALAYYVIDFGLDVSFFSIMEEQEVRKYLDDLVIDIAHIGFDAFCIHLVSKLVNNLKEERLTVDCLINHNASHLIRNMYYNK